MTRVFLLCFVLLCFVSSAMISRARLLEERRAAQDAYASLHSDEIERLVAKINSTLLDITVEEVRVTASPGDILHLILLGFDAGYAMDYDVCAQSLTVGIKSECSLTLREIGNYIHNCHSINWSGKCVDRQFGVYQYHSRAQFEKEYDLQKFYLMRPDKMCS